MFFQPGQKSKKKSLPNNSGEISIYKIMYTTEDHSDYLFFRYQKSELAPSCICKK